MSAYFRCRDCKHSDGNRTHGSKIRCKRYSCWVEPTDIACTEKHIPFPLVFDSVAQAEMIERYKNKFR